MKEMKEDVIAAGAIGGGHVKARAGLPGTPGQPSEPISEIDDMKKKAAQPGKGLRFGRYFTTDGVSPYDAVEWEQRTASIGSEAGGVVFEQRDVEVPRKWSQTATNIVASKYFHGPQGSPRRESSARQLIGRVATTMKQ
jgi:hypothetical protein